MPHKLAREGAPGAEEANCLSKSVPVVTRSYLKNWLCVKSSLQLEAHGV
jgi:hypothetical protein